MGAEARGVKPQTGVIMAVGVGIGVGPVGNGRLQAQGAQHKIINKE